MLSESEPRQGNEYCLVGNMWSTLPCIPTTAKYSKLKLASTVTSTINKENKQKEEKQLYEIESTKK